MRVILPSVLVAASLVVGAAAQAGSSVSTAASYPPEGGPGSMTISGGPAANRLILSMEQGTGSYLVSDAAGIVPGNDCETIDAHQIRCARHTSAALPDRFGASLGDGDDQFAIEMFGRGGEINGGEGDDTIRSAEHRNVVLGDDGQDRLVGRGGNDGLIGGHGRDSLYGGRGNDRLDARQRDRDRVVDCGRGNDVALLDRRLDPKPRGCETVLYRRHG